MSETTDIISIDHIIIAVRDLPAAEADYNLIFGRMPSWRGVHPGRGTGNVLYRLNNTYIELYAPIAEGPGADALNAKLDRDGEGLFGIAVGVTSAAEARTALLGRGLEVTEPVAGSGRDQMSGAVREWNTFGISARDTRGLSILAIEHKSPADSLPPAKLGSGVAEDSAVHAADHVVLMTSDAEACKKLFGEQLGIRLALDQSKPEWGMRQLFFRVGGVTLEIVEPLDAGKKPAADSFAGLAWATPDLAALCSRLAPQAELSEIRKGRKLGTEVATLKTLTHGVPTLLISASGK